MNFLNLLAKYVTGNFPNEQLFEIGIIGLQEGLDSSSLRILAGLEKNESSYVAERYLQLSLQELNILMPSKRKAALLYALFITNEIIFGDRRIIEGILEIKNKAIGSYDFISEKKQFYYDSIDFDLINGLYYSYDDLTDINPPLKSAHEDITKVKKELFEALIAWKPRLEQLCEIAQ